MMSYHAALIPRFLDAASPILFSLTINFVFITTGEMSMIENLFLFNKIITRSIGMFSYHE